MISGLHSREARIEELESQADNARQLQFNASELRDAAGVFRMGRELDKLYREIDDLRWRRA